MKESFKHYNSNLKSYARNLRNNSTKAEVRLWTELLRAKKMCGFTFNRQRPIDRYIVDFFCLSCHLIIEVDGCTHDDPTVKAKDVIRQKRLEQLGYCVIRFQNWEVYQELDRVKYEIEKKILELIGLTIKARIKQSQGRIRLGSRL